MQRLALSLLILLAAASCAQELQRGPCRFHGAERVLKLRWYTVADPALMRRDGDPNAVLLVLASAEDHLRGRIDAIRIDLETGAETETSVPYVKQPDGTFATPGHRRIATPEHPQSPEAQSFVRDGTLRVELDGHKVSFPAVGPGFANKKIRVVEKERYTGTHRVIYGRQPILEQQLIRYDHVPSLASRIAIDPDGDRMACMCTDDATWLAVFRRSALERASRGAQPSTENR